MELILWRHAEAEPPAPGQPDEMRTLTAKGHKQAARMAQWLDRHLPQGCKILSSPAVRTTQTVEALGRKFKTHHGLAPDVDPERILEAAHWPDSREPVLIVGHQPTLGQLASLLIAGTRQNWPLRKGAVCWIARKATDETQMNYLKAVLSPDLAGK